MLMTRKIHERKIISIKIQILLQTMVLSNVYAFVMFNSMSVDWLKRYTDDR